MRGAKLRRGLGKKGTPDTVPMSYERRLASYGLRDLATGMMHGHQSSPQRRRILHKIGHVSKAAGERIELPGA